MSAVLFGIIPNNAALAFLCFSINVAFKTAFCQSPFF